MKKIILLLLGVVLLSSCEDFLDVYSYTTYDSSTFPKRAEDLNDMLTGVYASMNRYMIQSNGESTYFMISELLCDDRFGGGGRNDINTQAYNHLLAATRQHMQYLWQHSYRGIARANLILEEMENIEIEPATKNQIEAETKFLRANFYFDLVRCLGNIPLMTSTPKSVEEAIDLPPQAEPAEIYEQMTQDLWDAYNLLPATVWRAPDNGRVTKWAAAGMLARVYLFYTGFYNQQSLPGGIVTKQQIIEALENLINNSGHSLVADYRTLWAYTNPLSKPDYPYAKDAADWVKDGSNPEHVFVIKMAPNTSWSENASANIFALSFAVRNQARDYRTIFPFGQGWGFGPVSSVLWDDWVSDEPDDPRRKASIWNPDEAVNPATGELGPQFYDWGKENQMEETGFWQKKISYFRAFGKLDGSKSTSDMWNSWQSAPSAYNLSQDNNQMGTGTDLIIIRFSDVLLMHSELTETTTGMNRVRARVDLPPIGAYSLYALQKERRYELCFEGHRWSDIRRWGGMGDMTVPQLLRRMYTKTILNNGVELPMRIQGQAGDVGTRYEATQGFFMIPQNEIDLSKGVLKQNPGWTDDIPFMFAIWL